MKIPKKINIGGIDFKIEIIKDISNDLNIAEYRGKVLFKKDKILILDSYSNKGKFRTLLHEIIHILDDNYRLELTEELIIRLASGLYQVLKDNKLLKEGD